MVLGNHHVMAPFWLQGQSCTLEKVLSTLHLVFSAEGTLSQHGPRLASQLAKLFTHQSQTPAESKAEDQEVECAVEELILTSWKL